MDRTRLLKALARQQSADARAVLANPAALRFLNAVLVDLGVDGDVMTGDNRTFYNAGRVAAGQHIIRALEAEDPNARLILLQTAAQARARLPEIETETTDAYDD